MAEGGTLYTWECVECVYEKKASQKQREHAQTRAGFYLRFRTLVKKAKERSDLVQRALEISVHVQDLPLLLQKVWSHARSKASCFTAGSKEPFGASFRNLYLSPYAFRTSRPSLGRGSRVWPSFIKSKWKPVLELWAREVLYHEQIPEDCAVQVSPSGKAERSTNKTVPNLEDPETLLGKTKVEDLEKALTYFKKIKPADLSSWRSFHSYVKRTPASQKPSCDETAWELTLAFVHENCPSFFLWAIFSQKAMEEFMYLHTSVSAERVWRSLDQKPSAEFTEVQEASPLGFFTNPLDEGKGGHSFSSGRSWRVGLHAEEGGWLEAGDGRHDELFPGFLTPHAFSRLEEGWKRALLQSMDDDSRNLVFVYWWLQAWCLCTEAPGLPEVFPNFDARKVEGRFCFLPFLQLASKLSVHASADHGPALLFSSLYQRSSGNLFLPVQTQAARKTIARCFETLVELGLVVKSEVEADTSHNAFLYKPTHFARVEEELATLVQELEEDLKPCKYWTRFVRTHAQLASQLPNAPPFSEEQLDAQSFLARHPLAVLDGCAGSGKSTVAAALVAGVLPAGVVSITKTAARALAQKVSSSAALLSAAPREDIRQLLELREAAGSMCQDPHCPCVTLRKAASSHLKQSLCASKKGETKKKKGQQLRSFEEHGQLIAIPFTQTVEWLVVKARFAAPTSPPSLSSNDSAQERVRKRQKTEAEKEKQACRPQQVQTRAFCLLVDEAETISLFKGLCLLRAVLKLAQRPAFLLFLGDPQQTAAIGVGNLQAFLKKELPTVCLSQSFRFRTNFVMKTLCAWFSSSGATPISPSQVLPSLSRGALARVFLDRADPSFFEQRFFHFLRTAPPSSFLSPSTGPGAIQVITFRNEERRRVNEWGYRFELARRMQARWSTYLKLPTKKKPLFLGLSVVVRCSPWLPPPDSLRVLEEGTAASQHRHESRSRASKPARWVPRPGEADAIPGTQGVVVGLFLVRVLVAQRKAAATKNEESSSSSSSSSSTTAPASDSESGGQRKLLLITTYAQVEASCLLPTSLYAQKQRPRGKHARGLPGSFSAAAEAYKGFWLKVVLDTGKRDEAGSPVCEEVFVDPNDPFQGGDCLQLAYALSVPAVTGLQYRKAVTWVSPKPFSPMHLHSRKLVYTGLSRNVVGPPEVWRCSANQHSSSSPRRSASKGDSEVTFGRYRRSDEEWAHAFRAILGLETKQKREKIFKGRASLTPVVQLSEKLAWDMHRNL